jgi:hypothetical protein
VVYGLLWKRATWKGAIAGYAAAAAAGVAAQFVLGLGFTITTFITAAVALAVTPLASLAGGGADSHSIEAIWRARRTSDEELSAGSVFHLVPVSPRGRFGLGLFAAGLLIFVAGVIAGGSGWPHASLTAVAGMIVYFGGGVIRAFSD